MVCIVMIVIRMPNDGVCPIQVVTQDADMAENINFNEQIVQNSTKYGAIVARMKQIPGTVATFRRKFWCWVVWNLIPRSIAFSDF